MHLFYYTRPDAHIPRIQNADICTGIPVLGSDRTTSASKPWVDQILSFNIVIFFLLQIYFYWFRDPSSDSVGGSFHGDKSATVWRWSLISIY